MGQKSSRTNIFPYIFHIKPWLILILIKLVLTRFHEILSIKSRNRYSAFMTYHRVCNKSNKTGAISRTGSATIPENLSSFPVFSGVYVAQNLGFLCNCLSLCPLAIVLSVHFRFTASDYPFGTFKLFVLLKIFV
jgi:hypothetical protein